MALRAIFIRRLQARRSLGLIRNSDLCIQLFSVCILPVRFVFLNQYYPPDVAPTGVMLEAVVEELARQGHAVTVLCAEGRALRMGRGTFAGKVLDYASYYSRVAWRLLWMRADVVVALTTPPYLSLLARAMTRIRGTRHAHWVMDVYPDVMVAHGMLKQGSVMHRLLGALARWGFGGKRCGAVLTLGPDMAERVGAYLPAARKAVWVPLWGTSGEAASDAEVAALRAARGWDMDEVVFLYSGNMGLGHRFADVLEAGQRMRGERLRLAFFGGGKRKPEIEAAVRGLPNGEVHDYVSRGELAAHLATGDVHLASLEPGWDGTMVPSKLQGIFEAGRPVLFTGSRTCSIGRWITESGGGWVAAPGDVEAHATAMREARDPAERARRGAAAKTFAAAMFDRKTNVEEVLKKLKS